MRRAIVSLAIAGVLLSATYEASSGSWNDEASPVVSPAGCPVTIPNATDSLPNGLGGPGGYQNDALWTNLWMWGENGVILSPGDGHITKDGAFIEMKWAWYRFKPGALTITGNRLDGDAPPLAAWIPEGYGETGFQVSGITFPTTGCWEVTGHLGKESLTFVVWVAIGIPQWAGTPAP